jgi:hypothetical protein
MTLEGVVTNVTKFGAFVDIGVHQDGLMHQRTGGPVDQGTLGRGQGDEGPRYERGRQDEADCAFDEDAWSEGRKAGCGAGEEAGAASEANDSGR